MARIRTIKPEFPHSETIGKLSRDARLLYIQLWTIVDDSGRSRGNSRILASLLYPYDSDAASLIDGWLIELEQNECIIRYQAEGSTYLQVCNWLKHQKIDKPSASKIPEFDESSRSLATNSRTLAPDLVPSTYDLVPKKEEANASSKKGSRINPDFELPDDWKAWALSETKWQPEAVAREFSKFRDYWVAKSGKDATKADWLATWRNWVRNAQDRQRAPPKQQTPLQAAHAAATAKMVERHNANLERTTRLVHGLGAQDLPGAVDEKIRDAGNSEYLPRGVAGNA